MLGECVEIGDEAIVRIPKENREWGFNPCPDGTKLRVLGFSEIAYGRTNNFGQEPGIYENKCWVKVNIDGREQFIGTFCLEPADKEAYECKLQEMRKTGTIRNHHKLRELPESDFWEMDVVAVDGEVEDFFIESIEYQKLSDSTYVAYTLTEGEGRGSLIGVRNHKIHLLQRGNVWKYYHNEPIEFASLEEEAKFFSKLGHTEEVRNPANGLYKWTKDEVLGAIRDGVAHGMNMNSGFLGSTPNPYAIRFRNEDLGKRVAAKTLEGFATGE